MNKETYKKGLSKGQGIMAFMFLLKFPHNCNGTHVSDNVENGHVEFEMNGPLDGNEENTQFILRCKKCGYNKAMTIATDYALGIRSWCLENGYESMQKAFQKLDCHICKEMKDIQEECEFSVKGMLGECLGYPDEKHKKDERIANKVFP